jgi:uncharacterized protein (TIGR02145 family)
VYATAPGSVASDGAGRNGLFTSKLLKYINTPNIALEQVFKYVARDVQQESQGNQIPWINYSYFGDFYFNGTATNGPNVKTEAAHVVALDYGYGTTDALTVTVGAQVWLGKNLNVEHFVNGDPIPEAKTEEEWKRAGENKKPAWCYYNNDPANGRIYGKLYNWYAVNDPRGLAPSGWHVPSNEEWDIAFRHLIGSNAEINKPLVSGNATYYITEGVGMLLKSTSGWVNSRNGNNSSGISGLPGGLRDVNGTFNDIGKNCGWWSASESATDKAWYRDLNSFSDNVYRNYVSKICGFSVRCVRD